MRCWVPVPVALLAPASWSSRANWPHDQKANLNSDYFRFQWSEYTPKKNNGTPWLFPGFHHSHQKCLQTILFLRYLTWNMGPLKLNDFCSKFGKGIFVIKHSDWQCFCKPRRPGACQFSFENRLIEKESTFLNPPFFGSCDNWGGFVCFYTGNCLGLLLSLQCIPNP